MNTDIPLYPVAGTRDFYPDAMALRNWLFSKWIYVAELYGYKQYDAPILEHTVLYTRKGGDDITNEMYAFKDRRDIDVCLRPEMTPSCVRMVINTIKKLSLPIRWFSTPQCWRYETTTRGRKREHYQWNVDNFGGPKIKTESEIIAMIVRFFRSVNLTSEDVVIKISNRMILQTIISSYGIDNETIIKKIFNVIDKLHKLSKDDIVLKLINDIGLSKNIVDAIFSVMSITSINKLEQYIKSDDLIYIELKKTFELFKEYGIADWVQLDLSIVRGLSYYTGIVFEAFFKHTTIQRSICGGGRYDNLMQKYGYPTMVPAVGFGLGDVVIMEGLKELQKLPHLSTFVEYCIVPYNKELYGTAVHIGERIIDKGKKINIYMSDKIKLRTAFRYADMIGASYVILIAPKEIANNEIVIKDLRHIEKNSKEQTVMSIDKLIKSL